MSDGTPSALERLWGATAGSERQARLGLSLERIVASGVELADRDGLGAVSMKRVAERLGFTTMSLYRYVASKDDLLLMMQDSCWRPPEGFDIAPDDWRAGLESWTGEQVRILRQHPWLEQVRHIERAGTPSQIMWMELGLRALSRTPLNAYQKVEVLLLLSGYTFTYARLSATAADGVQRGFFQAGEQAPAFAGLLRQLADPDRFPALIAAVTGGAFTPDREFPDFEFDLRVQLDGVEALIARA
ncbi:MAG TPA: TetR/AcrR family transcriptional regulator [Thermoleophilia bacterium]|nr:TetR/AcrR family transcriptional regulator [Thermoleophilia bacterium]